MQLSLLFVLFNHTNDNPSLSFQTSQTHPHHFILPASLDLHHLARPFQLLSQYPVRSDQSCIFSLPKNLEGPCFDCIDDFCPFLRRPLIKLRIGFFDIFFQIFRSSEEGRQVIFQCLFVTFSNSLYQILESCIDLLFYFYLFQRNCLLLDKFSLVLALESSFFELSWPFLPCVINETAGPVHKVSIPLPFEDSAVWELVDSLSAVFVMFPLASIDSSIGIVVSPISWHTVLWPLTFIHLFAHEARCNFLYKESSLSVFEFDAIEEFPLSCVFWPLRIGEPGIPLKLMKRDFGYFLLRRLLDHFLFDFFFRAHDM